LHNLADSFAIAIVASPVLQINKKTEKAQKKADAFPVRKFALKA
jgi:hypothetical protein